MNHGLRRGLGGCAGLLATAFLAGCGAAPQAEAPREPVQVTTKGGPVNLTERSCQLPSSGPQRNGLEDWMSWSFDSSGNPAALEHVSSAKTAAEAEGAFGRLAIELAGGSKPRTILKVTGNWNLSIKPGSKTRIAIHNDTGEQVRMSVAYSVSEKQLWYETPPLTLQTGWNNLEVEQSAADFKTESSKWEHTAALWKPDECRAVSLVFHGKSGGRLFLDYLNVTVQPKP